MREDKVHRRTFGVHYTPSEIFMEHIFPKIASHLWEYCWVDFYCGEGNLIFPILESIAPERRADFFREHIRLSDIDNSVVSVCIRRAIELGIPAELAEKNIVQHDNLEELPLIISNFPLFHITNPPYLYLGYISKHPETKPHLKYFEGKNNGLQDLYQIALANDLRAGIERMIYVIPSNFLFSEAGSNKARKLIFQSYNISSAIIFEKKIFSETGTNVMIGFFEKKKSISELPQTFELLKVNSKAVSKSMTISAANNWRAGGLFDEYVEKFPKNKEKISFYLLMKDLDKNPGDKQISLIDSSEYTGSNYKRLNVGVSSQLANKIKENTLWLRTVDTGLEDGKVGIYDISETFGVSGIVVGSNYTYRTSPMQIFFEPPLSRTKQHFVQLWVNALLNYLREETDGEFMTTYKYSHSKYTRKYLGLKQAKRLMETCPVYLAETELARLEKSLLEDGPVVFFNRYLKLNNLNPKKTSAVIVNMQMALSSFE